MTVLLRNYCNIKLRNIAGEPTAVCGKEVLMSALLTFFFLKLLLKKTSRHTRPEDIEQIDIQ